MLKNFRQSDTPGIALSGVPQSPAEARWIAERGLKAVVSLEPPSAEVVAALREAGVEHLQFPVTDFSEPLPGDLAPVLRFVQEHAKDGVLIHCSGGGGRAGSGYAAYLITQGVPVEEAIARAGTVQKESHRAFLYGLAAGLSLRSGSTGS